MNLVPLDQKLPLSTGYLLGISEAEITPGGMLTQALPLFSCSILELKLPPMLPLWLK
jgi:hypothetical protein